MSFFPLSFYFILLVLSSQFNPNINSIKNVNSMSLRVENSPLISRSSVRNVDDLSQYVTSERYFLFCEVSSGWKIQNNCFSVLKWMRTTHVEDEPRIWTWNWIFAKYKISFNWHLIESELRANQLILSNPFSDKLQFYGLIFIFWCPKFTHDFIYIAWNPIVDVSAPSLINTIPLFTEACELN